MLKKALLIVLTVIICATLCYINATVFNIKQIHAKEEIIKTSKFTSDDELVIAYFSDLHYGSYIDESLLSKTIDKINKFDPDIVIFGGDLLEKDNENTNELIINYLKQINSKYGKYAIYGETDISKIETINYIYDNSSFKVLNNNNLTINLENEKINIIGLNVELDINSSFNNINTNNYTIVLSHYPDYFDDTKEYKYDYMLSGHSHGPQIYIPLYSSFNQKLGCNKYYRGSYTNNDKTLSISNGIGRTDINARFMSDAQVNIYTIKKDTSTQNTQIDNTQP